MLPDRGRPASGRQRAELDLAESTARREAGERHHKGATWIDPTTRVSYQVSIVSSSLSCPVLGVTTDLTRVVDADLGEMIHSVKGRFCRGEDGTWRYDRT